MSKTRFFIFSCLFAFDTNIKWKNRSSVDTSLDAFDTLFILRHSVFLLGVLHIAILVHMQTIFKDISLYWYLEEGKTMMLASSLAFSGSRYFHVNFISAKVNDFHRNHTNLQKKSPVMIIFLVIHPYRFVLTTAFHLPISRLLLIDLHSWVPQIDFLLLASFPHHEQILILINGNNVCWLDNVLWFLCRSAEDPKEHDEHNVHDETIYNTTQGTRRFRPVWVSG